VQTYSNFGTKNTMRDKLPQPFNKTDKNKKKQKTKIKIKIKKNRTKKLKKTSNATIVLT